MSKEIKRCVYLSLIGALPLSLLGMALLFLFTHSGGILLQLGVALTLPLHLLGTRGWLDVQANEFWMWLLVCMLQFVYYLVMVCVIRFFYKAMTHVYRRLKSHY